MASETAWTEVQISDVGRVVTGRTPASSVANAYGSTIPFITPTDLDGRKVIRETLRSLSPEGLSAVRGAAVPAGAVLVSCIGSDMGKAAVAGSQCVTNQQINSVLVCDRFDREFIYYNLLGRKAELRQLASGAAQPILNKSRFSEVRLSVPSLTEQRRISSVLSALDDRIDHNRALAANLEAIARALFKSWFVDFDPVRAKAAGEAPPGLAPDLAALFPDRFVDSELGEIPEGWEFTPLSKLADFVNGRNFTKEATGSGRVVIRIAELSNGGPSGNTVWNDLPDTEDRYVANPGDVLFAWSGSLGVHVWEHDAGLVNQHIFKVLPRSRYCKPFCFFAVEEIIEDFRAIASGKAVTMGHIKRGDLDTHGVFCPSSGTLNDAFSNLVYPIWERARIAQRESLALTAMRDLLLPRLISGKLRVEDAEATLEDA